MRTVCWWAAVGVACFAGSATPLVAKSAVPYQTVYALGLRALDFESWDEALMLFAAASRAHPSEGELIRPYGMRFEPYLPYFHQGLCLFRLGRYAEALDAWRESESHGAIRERKNARWAKLMDGFRSQLGTSVSAAAAGFAAELGRARAVLDRQEARGRERGALPAGVRGRFGELRSRIDRLLAMSKAGVSADDLAPLRSGVEAAWAELANEDLAYEEAILRRAADDVARRNALAAQSVAAAMARVEREWEGAACADAALRAFDAVFDQHGEVLGGLSPQELAFLLGGRAGQNLAFPFVRLGRAWLSCGDRARARYFARVAELAALGSSESAGLTQAIDAALRSEELRVLIGEMKASNRRGSCDETALTRLAALRGFAGGADDEARQVIALTEGYLDCGRLAAAEALIAAVPAAAPPVAGLSAIRERIAAERTARERASERRAFGDAARSVAEDLSSPGCHPRARLALQAMLATAGEPGSRFPDDLPNPHELAARGALACDDLVSARAALTEARKRGFVQPFAHEVEEEIEARLARLARERDVVQAWSEVSLASAYAELPGCHRGALQGLERAANALGSGARPNLQIAAAAPADGVIGVKARLLRGCSDTQAVAGLVADPELRAQAPDQIAALQNWLEARQTLPKYKASFALLLGAAEYQEAGWQSLPGVRKDFEAVAAILRAHGFEIEIVWNPTSLNFDRTVKEFISRHGMDPDVRLVFYYAGHGWTESNYGIQLGYVVPVDSPAPGATGGANYLPYLVSMKAFSEYAQVIRARDVVFLFDSCFSGTVFEAAQARLAPLERSIPLRDALSKPARLFVTAGDEQQNVPDESAFRRAVVSALAGDADRDHDGLVMGRELGIYVAEKGKTQTTTPQWGQLALASFRDGDLAFERLAVSLDEGTAGSSLRELTARGDLDAWERASSQGGSPAMQAYLAGYPKGRFALFARSLAALSLERTSEPR